MGNVPGSEEFGPAPVQTNRPPFPGNGAESNSGGPSGGGGASVGNKDDILETELGVGPDVGSRVNTRTKEVGAEAWRRRNRKQEIDTTIPPENNEAQEAPAMNNTLLIAGGLALLFFLFKRKK